MYISPGYTLGITEEENKEPNEYLKIDDHVIVIYKTILGDQWKFSIDNVFSKSSYNSRERAMSAAFERLEKIRNSGK